MKLVIVESPSKAKTIQKYLGKEYTVMASGGHISDLPEKTLGIDIEHDFKPEYIINPKKKDLIKKLKQAVKDCDETLLATDPDREGEAISWHLATNLGIMNLKNRIEFNEISAKAVQAALKTPRMININLVDAQQARRVLDRLVGYKVSPILSRKIKSGLSGGRVQSAALKMLVDREKEIENFKPEEYWNIYAMLLKQGTRVPIMKATLTDYNGKKFKISNAAASEKTVKAMDNATWRVDKIKKTVSHSHPAPPFMTSTLQQDGSQKLGISTPQVMQIAQQLYEGIDLPGEGHTAFVTYIRTDSVRISADMQALTLEFIKNKFGKEYAPSKPNQYTTKSQNAQDAHEAIRPISLERTPDSVKDILPRNTYRLYKLIYDRYVASQMTDAEYDTMTVKISADVQGGNSFGFKLQGKSLKFKGYKAVYDSEVVADDEEVATNLPQLEENEILNLKEIKPEQKFTKPPTRYSEASLVKAMEESGIGRPSTYASVIAVLTKREYMVKEQKFIKPTALGTTVTEFLEKFFANIVDTNFTADMENKLDQIENGAKWQSIIAAFYPDFNQEVIKAYTNNDNKVKMPEEKSDVICDKCGATMVFKEGRFGRFLACPNYPRCRNVKSVVEPVGKCPLCGGNVNKCHSKTGKVFYGCSNYPTCKFMSWDVPAPILCPKCNNTMKLVKEDDKVKYVCSDRVCKNVIIAEDNSGAEDKDE